MTQARALGDADERRLRALVTTYEPGRRNYTRSLHTRTLGTGAELYERARERMASWEMHRRAGFGVTSSAPQVEVEAVLLLHTSVFGIAIHAPCRIIGVESTAARYAFTYVTLRGHPLAGMEQFALGLDDDRVVATTTTTSAPQWLLARLAAPLTRHSQERIAERYLGALATGAGPRGVGCPP